MQPWVAGSTFSGISGVVDEYSDSILVFGVFFFWLQLLISASEAEGM